MINFVKKYKIDFLKIIEIPEDWYFIEYQHSGMTFMMGKDLFNIEVLEEPL